MKEEKRVVELSDFEHRLLVSGLADLRSEMLRDHKPTEDINELLLKVIDAPSKKRFGRSDYEAR